MFVIKGFAMKINNSISFLYSFSLLIVAFVFITPSYAEKGKNSEQQELIKLINEGRKKNDLKPLKLGQSEDKAAQKWAEHMQKTNDLVHGGFDGAQCIGEGEDAKKVYNAWMGSKPHREGLMGKEYREIGIGKAGKYWVVNLK